MYINGHDHSQQHITKDGVQYFGNGVGGFSLHRVDKKKAWPENRGQEVLWAESGQNGFAMHEVTPEGMRIRFAHSLSPEDGAALPEGAQKDVRDELSSVIYETMVPFTFRGFKK
mmetsp:Transcript_5783/g.7686  ORF Transcript_5783/g.7686 Transcript_5783/m.7686 type:complete len:114 (-) Transcript_5783:286-627(-)